MYINILQLHLINIQTGISYYLRALRSGPPSTYLNVVTVYILRVVIFIQWIACNNFESIVSIHILYDINDIRYSIHHSDNVSVIMDMMVQYGYHFIHIIN